MKRSVLKLSVCILGVWGRVQGLGLRVYKVESGGLVFRFTLCETLPALLTYAAYPKLHSLSNVVTSTGIVL